jgi:hypothetical protein
MLLTQQFVIFSHNHITLFLYFFFILNFAMNSFASWSSVQFGSPDCYYHMDYIDRMIIQTLVPLFAVFVIFLLANLNMLKMTKNTDLERQVVGSRYFTLFLLLTYIVLPGVTIAVFGAFTCKSIDPDKVVPYYTMYMVRELAISCQSSRYAFGVNWAIAMIFVYPVGVLSMYFSLLYINREGIKHWRGIADERIVFEPVEDRSRPPSARSFVSGVSYLMDKNGGHGQGQGHGHEREHEHEHEEEGFACNLSKLISPREIKFLFKSYKKEFWYWEVIETSRRLLLTGVVSIVQRGDSFSSFYP